MPAQASGPPPAVPPSPGNELRRSRQERELSQRELAKRIQFAASYVNRIENAQLPMTAEFARACDRVLETGGRFEAMLPAPREPKRADVACPYPGFEAFCDTQAEWFFGRRAAVSELRDLVEDAVRAGGGLIAVVAASGAGKTSLLRAGLHAELAGGALPGSAAWDIQILTPGAAGRLPDPLPDVLIIDQFEELFTHGADDDERRFSAEVRAAAARTCVVAAVRSDFAGRFCESTDLPRPAWTYYLRPMTDAELREVILEPAHKVNLAVDPGVPEVMLRDLRTLRDTDGRVCLPLLAEALYRTWKERVGHRLTLESYAASGGVARAMERSATGVYGKLAWPEQRRIAETLLLRLVRLGDPESGGDSRLRVPMAELELLAAVDGSDGRDGGEQTARAVRDVIEALLKGRLLLAEDDGSVCLTHEVLLTQWPLLRELIEGNREELRGRQHFADAAKRWVEGGREAGLLARGGLLERGRVAEASLNHDEAEFLRRSEDAAGLERRAVVRHRRMRAALYAAGTAVLVASVTTAGIVIHNSALLRADQQASQATESQYSRPSDSVRSALAAYSTANTQAARSAVLNEQLTGFIGAFTKHGASVDGLAFRSDGRVAVSCDELGMVEFWDPDTRRRVQAPFHYPGKAFAVAYSPDGRTIGVAGDHGALLLDVSHPVDGSHPDRPTWLRGHTDAVRAIAFSHDGRLAATGSDDHSARLWDVASGRPLGAPLTGHADTVYAVAFSPDDSFLVTGSEDRSARTWSVADHHVLHTFEGRHRDGVRGVALSPDGRTLVTAGWDDATVVWDAASGAWERTLGGHQDSVVSASFSADGALLATGSQDDRVVLWDTADWQQVGTLTGHAASVNTVAFRPHGQLIGASSDDHTVALWDPSAGGTIVRGAPAGGINGLVMSGGGASALLASAGADGSAGVWDPVRLALLRQVRDPAVRGAATAVALNAEGTLLAVGGFDGSVDLWDPRTGTLLTRLAPTTTKDNARIAALAFSRDGRRLAAGSWDGTLRSWDTASHAAAPTVDFQGRIVFSAGYSDRGVLIAGGQDEAVTGWDGDSGRSRFALPVFTDSVLSLAVSGKVLLAGSRDGTLRQWSADAPAGAGRLLGVGPAVNALAISPDGRLAVAGGRDGSLRIWRLGDGSTVETLPGIGAAVTGAVFRDDDHLITGAADGTIRRWDLNAGRVAGALRAVLSH